MAATTTTNPLPCTLPTWDTVGMWAYAASGALGPGPKKADRKGQLELTELQGSRGQARPLLHAFMGI